MTSARRTIVLGGFHELETTYLGECAFEGNLAAVLEAVAKGIDWDSERTDPLHAALYGGRTEIATALLKAGSPISDETYRLAVRYCAAFVPALPPRPETARLELEQRTHDFNACLLRGELERAREILLQGIDPNLPMLLSHGIGKAAAIHYAARLGAEALELVLEAGANPNLLSSSGTSAARIVVENPSLSSAGRRAALAVLQAHGGKLVPPLSTLRARLKARLGGWIAPER